MADNLQKTLQDMVMSILEANNVLRPNKTFATVLEKTSFNTAAVFMEESQKTEVVQCASNAEIDTGDYVLIEYINNNPQDKFITALIRSASLTEGVDWTRLAHEPVRLVRNALTHKVERVYYGEHEYPISRQWNQELHRGTTGRVESVTSHYPDGISVTRFLIRDSEGRVVLYQ